MGDLIFEQFWNSYPKQINKLETYQTWQEINPNAELVSKILHAVSNQKNRSSWNIENGRYIPMPSNWLKKQRWLDEPEQQPLAETKTQASFKAPTMSREDYNNVYQAALASNMPLPPPLSMLLTC